MRISPHGEIQVVKPQDKVFQSKSQKSPKIDILKPTFKPVRFETNTNYIPLSNAFSPFMHLEQDSDVSPAPPVMTHPQIKLPRREAKRAQLVNSSRSVRISSNKKIKSQMKHQYHFYVFQELSCCLPARN